jgi:hypothetical protein
MRKGLVRPPLQLIVYGMEFGVKGNGVRVQSSGFRV